MTKLSRVFGFSPTREDVAFGVEIELTALPKDPSRSPSPDKWEYYQSGYDTLAFDMEERGLQVDRIEFKPNGGFKKYPKSYDKWYLTHDTSVIGEDERRAIPMEIVSRIFEVPEKDWVDEVGRFWKAFYDGFDIELSNQSCGSHVHIKPSASEYTMVQLRSIAYAVVIYEKHILTILPPERRGYDYCQPNTKVSPSLEQVFWNGKNRASFETLRQEIGKIHTPEDLYIFMQGDEEGSRKALWNFKNLLPGSKGTIEFRGISGVHSGQETVDWILFALGFILLAIKEDRLGRGTPFSFLALGDPKLERKTQDLWERVGKCSRRCITEKRVLPDHYTNMVDAESRPSRSRVRESARSTARSRSRDRSSSRSLSIAD